MAMTAAERSARYRLKHGAKVRERAKLKQRERRARVKEVRAVKPAFPDPPSDPNCGPVLMVKRQAESSPRTSA